MYSGDISGTGPRYCLSNEDKGGALLADRAAHQIFSNLMASTIKHRLSNGIFDMLPEEVQARHSG